MDFQLTPEQEALKKEFDTFFEAIEQGRPMQMAGLAEAVNTHEVIFAAERSLKEKRPVKMDEVRAR